jgi:parvulin-like peptidyl-prolyl isomerase
MDPEGNLLTGPQLESQRNIAQSLYNKAIGGEDFTALVTEYGQDAEMGMTPGGFPIPRGSGRGPVFDHALAGLKAGEISLAAETESGFYIIRRLPPDPSWGKENRDFVYEQYIMETYERLLDEWRAQADVVVDETFETIDVSSYAPAG